MRLPRLRFTVRRMMVAVAVFGSLVSVEAMRRLEPSPSRASRVPQRRALRDRG